MRFLFIVQGEGRGHMTQALALSSLLRRKGHQIAKVVVGTSPSRKLPDFFLSGIEAPILQLQSPNFIKDKKQKSIKLLPTLIQTIWAWKTYLKSIRALALLVKEEDPDVIINFYDFLAGIYKICYKSRGQFICIAHQYLISHPEFTFPKGKIIERLTMKLANQITSFNANKILALSFQYFKNDAQNNFFIVPPLLRSEVMELDISENNYLLVYVVNAGYGEEIEGFHARHPSIPIICFWDHKEKPKEYRVDDNLIFHQLDDLLFLEKMAACKGFVTTAGFEAVCEAMYLGKPTMMVPVEGHYEQACNAIDAAKAGAGISSESFDLGLLIDYIPAHENTTEIFQPWARNSDEIFIQHLT
jgi:uncharacterized protein (TIGR00661 family)